jgi:hypothetical protein
MFEVRRSLPPMGPFQGDLCPYLGDGASLMVVLTGGAMTTRSLEPSQRAVHVSSSRSHWSATDMLVACGVVYAMSYAIINDAIAAPLYGGYSWLDQAVSELSAEGASTRPFLVAMLPIWSALLVAFGVGIWRAADTKRSLRALGAVIAAHGLWSLAWLWFPMSARADLATAGPGVNDTGHLVLAAMTGVFALAEFALAAVAFGSRFRVYAGASVLVMLVFGALTGTAPTKMEAGEPTPWMGLFERISIVVWLVLLATVAITLLRQRRESNP